MTIRAGNKNAQDLIDALVRGRVRAVCPHCADIIPLSKAGLFQQEHFTEAAAAWLEQKKLEIRERREELSNRPRSVSDRSHSQAAAVNLGNILERIAPALPTFPLRPTECRSLFDPIDYIAFPGADAGKVTMVEFVELKSGGSRLNKRQRQVRDAVERGRVSLATYNVENAR